MAFLDDLREYLQQILDRPAEAGGAAPLVIDPATIRSQLIRCLEQIEEKARAEGESVSKDTFDKLLRKWQHKNAVVRFARRLARLLLEGMSQGAPTEEITRLIEVALARQLGLPNELSSVVRTLELDRLSDIAYADAIEKTLGAELPDVADYATAIQATRRAGTSLSLMPIGRVLLEFVGRDAIRWLLHVEVAQSTGPGDAWRVSRRTAQALAQDSTLVLEWGGEDADLPGFRSTMERLKALGLVSFTDDEYEGATLVKALPLGRELLSEIAETTDSPMSILASSLLADLALSAAEVVAKPSHEEARARASAAEATARQARLVAHEIRNTLVPVKTSLGALYREVLLNPSSEALARRRESIDRGIDAVFRFVEQLVKLSELAAKPPEPFDPLAAIRDAVSLVESESGKRIEQSLPLSLPPVSGHRARVVMAITNVLRNATQAVTGSEASIRVSAEPTDSGRAVLVTIDDNGPGVPENMRQAIFEEGISLRPGGSGMGLALVREVFEKEMRGWVDCGASQLGGARFTIRMPTAGAG